MASRTAQVEVFDVRETRSQVRLVGGAVREARSGTEHGIAVRMIKQGRLGFAAATARPGVVAWLRERAAESAADGERRPILLPGAHGGPSVAAAADSALTGADRPAPAAVLAGADPADDGGLAGCLHVAARWGRELRDLAGWEHAQVMVTERTRTVAIRSSAGLAARYRGRLAYLAVAPPAALTPAGGIADVASGPALDQLDLPGLAARLPRIQRHCGDPVAVMPGEHDLLMSPAATALLLGAVAGRWCASGGEALGCDPRLLIADDGVTPLGPHLGPVDDEGVARRRNAVVADGGLAAGPAVCGTAGQPPSTGSALRPTFREPPRPAPAVVRLLAPLCEASVPDSCAIRVHVIRPRALAASGSDRLVEFAGFGVDGRPVTGRMRVSLRGLLGRIVAAGRDEWFFPLQYGAGGRWLLLSGVPVQ